ncbi:MAG: glutamate-1-semialdehyde 2,1-aminomutase [Deltaproteobacteria bacterium]|nr:glutamate-1-semialdehyde 2,1-aminomutase [Deltaproteobacteria bacterium]MBI2182367.1 glutamate-1-semialdehyde 2,1-aminomutase [Deltaproteobacteria bacterium]MBI2367183.1 glutamate-1-semialdehyde 2,1-aminomutase [Deltaproteobacteria bacterium]
MATSHSRGLFQRAKATIPGGVNSPVRAWKAVGGAPLYIARGQGAHVYDSDGNRYIDFVGSWGPLIFGHAHPQIVRALGKTARNGTTFGAPTEQEVKLAELIVRLIPSVQKVRLVSSGTEATMSALRLARAYTGRSKIVKFDGCYHGHADGLLVKAGSGIATLGLPDSPGIPPGFAKETLVAKYNDVMSVSNLFERHGKNIAALIVEPVCGNMGVIPPAKDFLRLLRRLTRRYGTLLIFDEVITGFRVAVGGAQSFYGVTPDLTCLGKILGGGLPLAAFGGRRQIMDLVAPEGPVYQAGTLSGNPLAVTAGLTTLGLLSRPGTYARLEVKGKRLEEGFTSVLKKYSIRGTINRVGSMMTLFFGIDHVRNADDARNCDRQRFARYFHGMLRRGIYLPPAAFEAMFVSLAHTTADINRAVAAFENWAAKETRG